MIDSKGRIWLIDLNGASPLEVGPNALTQEYAPPDVYKAAQSYWNTGKTTPWAFKNIPLDMYLLGNTLVHLTACAQEADKADCKPNLKNVPAAADDYNESWQDLITKLRAPQESDRISVADALKHPFLDEVDLAAAKAIVANIANFKNYIKTWETTSGKKFRENVDVAKKSKRFKVLVTGLNTRIGDYADGGKKRQAADAIEQLIWDLEDRQARLIGGGASKTDMMFKTFARGESFDSFSGVTFSHDDNAAITSWGAAKKAFPPPAADIWIPPTGTKSKVLLEAEKNRAKGDEK